MNSVNVTALIPCRYASKRLPGKPLLHETGKPLVQHVYENVLRCASIDRVIVATDDERIYEAAKRFGAGLGQRFGMEKDPAAAMALVDIMKKPGDADKILTQLFTPEDPQMTPEQQAMMEQGMGGPGGEGIEAGPPPAVQTILSQMESAGGGVQSVGQL